MISHQALARRLFYTICIPLFLCAAVTVCAAQTTERRTSIAVLDFGETETGLRAADRLWQSVAGEREFQFLDCEMARAGARGAGYAGSLNMSLSEARDLGA